MSRDDFTEIEEVSPGKYEARHGTGENPGKGFLFTDDLKLAIKRCREFGAEYGIYFKFLDDPEVAEN